MAEEASPQTRLCLNPHCTRKNPVKGNWCTAKECKNMRKLAMAAKKEDTLQKACAAVGVPVPAAKPADGGQCFELHSVHGVLDCDFPHLGGKSLEKAPPDDPKELRFLVYGTFAASGSLSAGGIGAPNFYKVLAPKWSYRSYHWSGNISPLTEPFSLLPRS